MNEFKNHTFAICAYKESKYLEECIKSLKNQNIKSNIIMATSTPNDYIKKLADKYNIELFINTGERGIGQDWNFAVSSCKTDYVTVAHQDDIYNKNFLEGIVKYLDSGKDFIISFGDYLEIKNGQTIPLTINLKIKKFLLKPLIKNPEKKYAKMHAIKYGNGICCPSVTINTKKCGKTPYLTDMKCDLDWDTWYKLSKKDGAFLYINKEIMCHRIHEESETTNLIENNIRLKEDYEMFKKFWPKPIAKFLVSFYKNATKTNS